jgi:hypothetical protein
LSRCDGKSRSADDGHRSVLALRELKLSLHVVDRNLGDNDRFFGIFSSVVVSMSAVVVPNYLGGSIVLLGDSGECSIFKIPLDVTLN